MLNRDLNQKLLGDQGKKHNKMYHKIVNECERKVKMLKNKNNDLQKQCDNDLQDDIRIAIKNQSQFIEMEINELKNMLLNLNEKYSNPQTKVKIKQLWKQTAREIQRNKRIMKEIINKSSSVLIVKRSDQIKKTQSQYEQQFSANIKSKRSISNSVCDYNIESDIDLKHKIERQKADLLKQLEQKNYRIFQIMEQMGKIVGQEQKDLINILDENLLQAKQNVQQANNQLKQAKLQQKKARKKYKYLAILLLILLLGGGITLYFYI